MFVLPALKALQNVRLLEARIEECAAARGYFDWYAFRLPAGRHGYHGKLFSIPGIGSLIVDSISLKDEPMIIGCAIMVSVCFTLLMIGVDLIYAFIDPRIRAKYSKRR